MLALIVSLAVASPVEFGLAAGGGYGMNTGSNSCLTNDDFQCSTATAKGPAGGFGLYGLYRLNEQLGIGGRGESILVFGDDRAVSASGLVIVRYGTRIFAEGGAGAGWARFSRPQFNDPAGARIVSTDAGFAAALGFGGYVAPHVALTVRGGLITGVPGMAYVTGGFEFSTN